MITVVGVRWADAVLDCDATGMKEFPPAWPAPKSMRTVVGDEDEVRIQKVRANRLTPIEASP